MQRLRELGLTNADFTFPQIMARQAQRNGDRCYLLFEQSRWSYGEADRLTDRIANGLLDSGIRPGDHVVVMMGNGPEIIWVTYALGKIGAVSCPLNTAARGDLLAYFFTQSDAVAAIVGDASWSRFASVAHRMPSLRTVIRVPEQTDEITKVTLPSTIQCIPYESVAKGADRSPGILVQPNDPQGIFFTSGTTGPSKGVLTTNAQSFAWSVGRVEFLGYQPQDVLYTCLPLFHLNALNSAAIAALVGDSQLALSRRFSASRFWTEVRETKATQFNLLGSMVNMLWAQPISPLDGVHAVRQCGTVPVPIFAPDFEKRFRVKFVTSYAITDAGQGTFLQPGYPQDKFRSTGKPRPGVEIEIRDENDQVLPARSSGEICMRSADPALAPRTYYKMPEANTKATRNGWFHTGDRGYFDDDGYLWFVDRDKDAIRRRGENVSSWEVEQIIGSHPAVLDVAVFPVSSEMQEDEVMACVSLKEGQQIDPAALIHFCNDRMAYYMVPRYVEFLPELPRNMSEKVHKRELRASAESRLIEVWDRERAGIHLSR